MARNTISPIDFTTHSQSRELPKSNQAVERRPGFPFLNDLIGDGEDLDVIPDLPPGMTALAGDKDEDPMAVLFRFWCEITYQLRAAGMSVEELATAARLHAGFVLVDAKAKPQAVRSA